MLRFDAVSFAFGIEPLFTELDLTFAPGWTGIVGPNGAGKTTLLRLAIGELEPAAGHILRPGSGLVALCPQRTDAPIAGLAELLGRPDGEAARLAGELALGDDWVERWPTLSHGERKRAQIAVAIWRAPDVLALDEPTNHIDAGARRLLWQALRRFPGVGILVSHDRQLLDELTAATVILGWGEVTCRPGGYSRAVALARAEEESAHRRLAHARQEISRLEAAAAAQRHEAARSDRRRSKRGLAPRDHDGRARIDRARLTGKDGVAGGRQAQLDGRVARARAELAGRRVIDPGPEGIWLPGTRSQRAALVDVPAASIAVGPRMLAFPDLRMGSTDRVGVTGPNGAGKSTLVRFLLARTALPAERVIHVPQEIDADDARQRLDEVRRLPPDRLGRLMTIVSRLGSEPERLLASREPSPGEIRKLLVALGIQREAQLIVLDEPTNHLDLPAIELLEAALDECPGGLLLVSHDLRLLERLVTIRWQVEAGRVQVGAFARASGE